jgi:peptide/nickel transport system substrate-binding protein
VRPSETASRTDVSTEDRGSPGGVRSRLPQLAALAAFVIAIFVVAACGSSNSSGGGDSGTPQSGGTLTFARTQDADVGLDPINAPSNGSIFTIQQIFDQLVEVQGDELVPGLAKSWDHSADGKVWTFNLRDAQFSNGEPVTAEDVKFSLDRFADPDVNVAYTSLGDSIKSVDVVDAHTVKVTLDPVDGSFIYNMAMFAAAIVPQKVVEQEGPKFAENPVGSGPFMVKDYVRGKHTLLTRNPNYWREGQPYLDEVDFQFVPDANTRVLELRSGQVDVADGIPYNQVDSLQNTSGVNIEVADSLKWDSIWFDTRKAPLNEVEVRQALNYATPKDQILNAVLFGNGQVANSQIPPVKYWDESIDPYPYDIDKAKELLSKSSVPDGFDLELVIPAGDQVEQQEAEIIKSEWAKIGVNVNIVPRDFETMFGDWLSGKGGQAATFPGDALSSDTLSDDELAALVYDPDSGLYSLGTYYKNQKILSLLADAKGTVDEDQRAKDFAEIQQLGLDGAQSVPLFFTKSITGYQDKVQDFQTYPIGWWPLRETWISQ